MEVELLPELGTIERVVWGWSYTPCFPSPLLGTTKKVVIWIVPDNPKVKMKDPLFKTGVDNG